MFKVLIVDDEPNIVMTLDFLMRKQGYEVFLATDGAEAIQLIDEQTPDLLLLDIMMPNVNGYEVCQYVRNNEVFKNTRIIFLSAKTRPQDIAYGMELGADAYLGKPFSTRELLKKIKELLENRTILPTTEDE
jgi:DNA-binding response OmpR family regulator